MFLTSVAENTHLMQPHDATGYNLPAPLWPVHT